MALQTTRGRTTPLQVCLVIVIAAAVISVTLNMLLQPGDTIVRPANVALGESLGQHRIVQAVHQGGHRVIESDGHGSPETRREDQEEYALPTSPLSLYEATLTPLAQLEVKAVTEHSHALPEELLRVPAAGRGDEPETREPLTTLYGDVPDYIVDTYVGAWRTYRSSERINRTTMMTPTYYCRERRQQFYLPAVYMVGVAKAGSTTLYAQMMQHPRLVGSKHKEYRFWAFWCTPKSVPKWIAGDFWNYVRTLTDTAGEGEIRKRFDPRTHLLVDGSTAEFWSTRCHDDSFGFTVPHALYQYTPEARIIAVVREPASRMWSGFRYHCAKSMQLSVFRGLVEGSISEFFDCMGVLWEANDEGVMPAVHTREWLFNDMEKLEVCAGRSFHHEDACKHGRLNTAMYALHLYRWWRVFPREQIKLITTPEIKNMDAMNKEVYEWLGLEPLPHGAVVKANKNISPTQSEMDPGVRAMLVGFFRPFNEELAAMLGDPKFLFGIQ